MLVHHRKGCPALLRRRYDLTQSIGQQGHRPHQFEMVGTFRHGEAVQGGKEGVLHGAEPRPVGRQDASDPVGLVSPQQPLKVALPGPCSKNDSTPCRASSVSKTSMNRSSSRSTPHAVDISMPSSMARLAARMATRGPAA